MERGDGWEWVDGWKRMGMGEWVNRWKGVDGWTDVNGRMDGNGGMDVNGWIDGNGGMDGMCYELFSSSSCICHAFYFSFHFICPLCPPIHICPSVPSVHLFHLFHLSICSIYSSVPSVYLFCLSTCSHLSQFHPSTCSSHPSLHICLSVHIHSSLPFYIQSILSCSILPPEQPNVPQKELEVTVNCLVMWLYTLKHSGCKLLTLISYVN